MALKASICEQHVCTLLLTGFSRSLAKMVRCITATHRVSVQLLPRTNSKL